ncbi:hypothetical protein X971_1390 [Agrobacterium tumefaciens LBA4213 (Ach5)]|nr:hypothetical protein X971_1390 [Agrobacterium tumefaciens LBA4213 (Ach5)]
MPFLNSAAITLRRHGRGVRCYGNLTIATPSQGLLFICD